MIAIPLAGHSHNVNEVLCHGHEQFETILLVYWGYYCNMNLSHGLSQSDPG